MSRDVVAPSTGDVGLREKGREWYGYLRNHRHRPGEDAVRGYLADVEEYGTMLRRHSDRDLAGAEVLEIGFGTRPSRLAVLSAAGAVPLGVDMEVPLLDLKPATLRRVLAHNGGERLAKSVARYLLFDRAARERLRAALADKYGTGELDFGRLEIRDAADLALSEDSLDLVISEDVFEHMTAQSIARTLAGMRRWLRPGALALIRPNVFTGITGGHLAEWSVASVRDRPREPRRSRPWGHLRGNGTTANTQLNRFSRAEYRSAFAAAGFELLEERCRYPELGAELITPALREELANWPDEELFSNQTLFVLRPAAPG